MRTESISVSSTGLGGVRPSGARLLLRAPELYSWTGAGDPSGLGGVRAELPFRTVTPDSYEIQFARGRCAVSVYGFALFGVTSPALEGVVHEVAERWYALTPGS